MSDRTFALLLAGFVLAAGASAQTALPASEGLLPDVVVLADDVLRGTIDVATLRVPLGVTMWFDEDLVVRSAGDIVLEGNMRAWPGSPGASLTLTAGRRIVVLGTLEAGRGTDGTAAGEQGGRGGDLLLLAPEVLSAFDLKAGDGGLGGPGASGGDGGDAILTGALAAPPDLSGTRPRIVGGNGGKGGLGLQGPNGGLGGDGGNGGRAGAPDDGSNGAHGATGATGPNGGPGGDGGAGGDEVLSGPGANGVDDTSPCGQGGDAQPGASTVGGFGGNGGKGGTATLPTGTGGTGGKGGNGGDAVSTAGGTGGDSGDCCFLPEVGRDGGDGGDGGFAWGGIAGAGGDGGLGGVSGFGGDGGNGGNGGDAVAADGGNGGNGGDGDPAGWAGFGGFGGTAEFGWEGFGGAPGNGGLSQGAAGSDGVAGVLSPGDPGLAGTAGIDCPAGATWTDVGCGTGGFLTGAGTLAAGSANTLSMGFGVPTSTSFLVASTSFAVAPFKGGWLVPGPPLVIVPLPIPAGGAITLPFTVPPTPPIPSGTLMYLQWATPVGGFTLSNGLRARFP